MVRLANIIASLFVIIFSAAGITATFFPQILGNTSGFNPISDYGLTNIRTLGAPLLMMAAISAYAIFAKNWILLAPACIYFLFNGMTRLISLFNEEYDPVMLRGIILTFSLFLLASWVIKTLKASQEGESKLS